MKMGLPMYHVERTVQEAGTLFGDGSHIIYVNGSYKDDGNPAGKLMHDFRCTSAVDMLDSAASSRERDRPQAHECRKWSCVR